MSQAITRTDESTETETEPNQPTPSLDAFLRIYHDARVVVNVEYDREISPGGRIDEDEVTRQLRAEGYSKTEADNILDLFERRGDLSRDLDGVAPTVLQVTVEEDGEDGEAGEVEEEGAEVTA